MRNFVCWNSADVRQVINPYAEHIPDSLFRAVHTDWNLKVSPPIGKSFQEITAASYSDMEPLNFLEDFLREDRPHALAVVLGTTGSGKSHLIHWMRLNLRQDPRRVVLVVRKSGTNLRAIVEMLINELPIDEQQGFRDTLNRAGEATVTRDGQKQQLLNDLAHAIREEVVPHGTSELEGELVKQLPNLFQDPYMREAHFLRDGTIVAEIVDHIFATSNAGNRPDKRRIFDEEDLPLGGNDFVHASTNARNAIKVLQLEPSVTQPLAIQIINRNLDKATARTLSFSGDRVEELMGRLRISFKRQGKELILLIEEFARLQGIDRALLQAITHQGDGEFCKMRSAIAVTTGFFESVAETAYMRTTHIVDMDRSAGRASGGEVTRATLSDFTSRYLNAVRLGRSGIDQWNDNADPGERPPSKCATCLHQVKCHSTFGESDGYGLYPFTATALWNAAIRVDSGMPSRLNPRILQNDLLAEVLDVYEPSIRTGTFPPYRFLEKLGGPKALNLAARGRLQALKPDVADRLIAFLELYDGTGLLHNLPVDLREAFDVPEIQDVDTTTPVVDPIIPPPEPPNPNPSNPQDLAIEQWINGGGLDQNVANSLRPLIFSAVADAIDWDILGLERSAFVGKTGKAFQTNSISFDRQTTAIPGYLAVKLRIPGEDGAVTTGAALQGLLRASRNQFRWDFEDGDRLLSAFLDCVGVWSRSVEDQLRTISAPSDNWNHSIAALQLLCVAAALSGKIKPEATIADIVDAAFQPLPPEGPSTTQEIRSLYDRLLKRRDKLVDLARAQISSMKGGRVGAMLDPHKFMAGIRALRHWQLALIAPEDEKGDYAMLAKLYGEVQRDLEKAVEAECEARLTWLREMEEAFGPDATRATIIASLTDLRELAKNAGVAGGGNINVLGDAIEQLKSVNFDDALNAVRGFAKQDKPLAALPQLGRGRRNAVEAGSALKKAAIAFLDNVDQNLTTYATEVGSTQSVLRDSIKKIDVSLNQICSNLSAMSLTVADASHVD